MYKFITILFAIQLVTTEIRAQPISLHPENNHYLVYNEKPLVLVTSAEHYGAVINLDFDFEKYLTTLHCEGMNFTRIFIGSYVEIPGSFGIGNNTLAPLSGRFLAPWKRTEKPGLFDGENKFDLDSWEPAFFERLKVFVSKARDLQIIVEITLFCATYDDTYWKRHPFNSENNINGLPRNLDRKKSNTTENGILTEYQKKLTEKIVRELNNFDNVFYEIQNEPWADDGVKVMRTLQTIEPNENQGDWFKWAEMASMNSLEWQKIIAETITETELTLPKKHLIAQNYTNFFQPVGEIDSNVSIMNFHYAWPDAVWMNYGWNRPVSFDESGFAGNADSTYLRQAWHFMLAGGAIFNNLDYSFFVEKEDGTGVNKAPGGGSKTLRKQLVILRNFIESLNFVKMAPDFNVNVHSPGLKVLALSEPGKQYAMVLTGRSSGLIKLNLPKGKYSYEIISPTTGESIQKGFFRLKNDGLFELKLPIFSDMAALKIMN